MEPDSTGRCYNPRVTIAILAGGQSRRMGQDKAALFLPTLQQAAEATGLPVIVVGRDTLPDETPGVGPLGGLATALRHVQGPVLAVACDMPLLDTAAFLWLVAKWEALERKPLGLVVDHLFAIYTPACLPRIDTNLAAGQRSLYRLLQTEGFVSLQAPPELAPKLANINTPEDWERFCGIEQG